MCKLCNLVLYTQLDALRPTYSHLLKSVKWSVNRCDLRVEELEE